METFLSRLVSRAICLFILSIFSCVAFAHNKVVVVPLFGGGETVRNVVTVGAANADFTDLADAVSSITNAAASNRYLILIGPGDYVLDQRLNMKPYVSLAGSGAELTTIRGDLGGNAVSESSAVLMLANNSTVSALTVLNTGGAAVSIGVFADGVDVSSKLQNTSLFAEGGTSENYGMVNNASSPIMNNLELRASGDASTNYGVLNRARSSPTLTLVVAEATGGNASINFGVRNEGSAPILNNVNATGSAGSSSFGVYDQSSGSVIRFSQLEGESAGLFNDVAGTLVSHSTIIGGISGPGAKSCVAVDNGSGAMLGEICDEVFVGSAQPSP